jgi:hypothetical protein
MTSAVLRGLVCPKNLTPCGLDISVGVRGTEDAGRLLIGLKTDPEGGLSCTDDGLAIDPCFVQNNQFKQKIGNFITNTITYTRGLIP